MPSFFIGPAGSMHDILQVKRRINSLKISFYYLSAAFFRTTFCRAGMPLFRVVSEQGLLPMTPQRLVGLGSPPCRSDYTPNGGSKPHPDTAGMKRSRPTILLWLRHSNPSANSAGHHPFIRASPGAGTPVPGHIVACKSGQVWFGHAGEYC
jgi:hypothetical protein